jgi:hypothetical protein
MTNPKNSYSQKNIEMLKCIRAHTVGLFAHPWILKKTGLGVRPDINAPRVTQMYYLIEQWERNNHTVF